MKNQGTIAQIQCPEPVTERHHLTVPPPRRLGISARNLLAFYCFCLRFVLS